MNDDELGRLLGQAFDAQARGTVRDDVPVPPRATSPIRRRRLTNALAPLAAAAAVVLAVGVGVALTRDGAARNVAGGPSRSSWPSSSGLSGPATPSSTGFRPIVAPASAREVALRITPPDGVRVGVGLPVIVRFDHRITDGRSLAAVTTVTANGHPLPAAWYFVASAVQGLPVEGHLRPETYWPAHATIVVTVRARHLSAGTGLRFAGDVTSTFTTGARTIATVDARTHLLRVQSDGHAAGQFKVSLGAARTPTLRGVKVIMAQRQSVCMSNVNGLYHECGIQYAQQITASGEFLHSAPWNVNNIGVRNTSNGCTNMLPADAKLLFAQLEVGDVVVYANASGPAMTLTDGYGDWDVPWSTWLTGGLVPTR